MLPMCSDRAKKRLRNYIFTVEQSFFFTTIVRRNIRACIEDQNHHREPKVSEGKIMNSEFYLHVLRRLVKRVSRVRPRFPEEGFWLFLQEYSPAHSAMIVKRFLVN